MVFTSNQFALERQKGKISPTSSVANILKCRIDASETGTLSYGYGVEVVGATTGVISVIAASAVTSNILGFINYGLRTDSYVAGDYLDICIDNTIQFMEASAAFNSGVELQYDPSTQKVATRVAPNTVIGISMEKAAGDTSIVPVMIKVPSVIPNELEGITATTAELNKADTSVETETILAAGVLSADERISYLALVGAGAVTLATPDAAMIGLIKVIEMTVDNGDVTLSLANVQGGTAATTCTWSAVGQTLVLVGGLTKWNVASEGGVALT